MFDPSLITWRAQYDRLCRMFTRLSDSYESSVEHEDDLQHFFQDCWHLKDWIKNDPSLKLERDIEETVKGHISIMIAADLATASKHYVRSKKREERPDAYVIGKDVSVTLGQTRRMEVDYRVLSKDGSVVFANQVVIDAMHAWQAILKELGLIQ